MLLEEGNVFEEELFLQILGSRRHDDSLAREKRRNQVGERLACSRACLDDQVLAILERRLDRLRHLELARPELEVRMPFGKGPLTREELARAGGAGLCHIGNTS